MGSADIKVKKTAQDNLSDICKTLFVSTLCGVVDFYNAEAKLSCKVPKVTNAADGEEAETTKLRLDSNLRPNLAKEMKKYSAMNSQASSYLLHNIKADRREAIQTLAMFNFLLLCKIGFRAYANILQE